MTRAEARRGDPGAFAAATAVMPEHSDRSRDVPRPSDIRSGVAPAEELDALLCPAPAPSSATATGGAAAGGAAPRAMSKPRARGRKGTASKVKKFVADDDD